MRLRLLPTLVVASAVCCLLLCGLWASVVGFDVQRGAVERAGAAVLLTRAKGWGSRRLVRRV